MGVYNGEPKASYCKVHTDGTRIFFRSCEKKQKIECKVFSCGSVIGHACQNIIGPTGERERDNSRTIGDSIIKGLRRDLLSCAANFFICSHFRLSLLFL